MIIIYNKITLIKLFIDSLYDLLVTEFDENIKEYPITSSTLNYLEENNIDVEKFLKNSNMIFEDIKREIFQNLIFFV